MYEQPQNRIEGIIGMSEDKVAVISGVGAGLGASLVRRFASGGYAVGMLARSTGFMESLAGEIRSVGGKALPVPTDITDPEGVKRAFALIHGQLGPPDVLINHAGNAVWGDFLSLSPEGFERSWRICAMGSFLCCRHAVEPMLKKGNGCIIFTGATSSIRGKQGGLAFSSAKFAVRGLADSLARELWPKGIHVAHVLIDGVLDTPSLGQSGDEDPGPVIDVDAAADAYWNLAHQDRRAWTFEIELRAYEEDFYL